MYPTVDQYSRERLLESISKRANELGYDPKTINYYEVEFCTPVTYELIRSILYAARQYKLYVESLEENFSFERYTYPSSVAASLVLNSAEVGLLDEKDRYLEYFIHDLDFGNKYTPGMIVIDGIDYPLSNSIDLWIILMANLAKQIREYNSKI